MPGLFNNLFKKNLAKKLRSEIENTELKKQSLIAPLQAEINIAQQKINFALQKIGLVVYESYVGGTEANKETLQSLYKEVTELKVLISEKENKISAFSARYDKVWQSIKKLI